MKFANWMMLVFAPATPFLIWSFVSKLKNGKKPWIECAILGIAGFVYIGMWINLIAELSVILVKLG